MRPPQSMAELTSAPRILLIHSSTHIVGVLRARLGVTPAKPLTLRSIVSLSLSFFFRSFLLPLLHSLAPRLPPCH